MTIIKQMSGAALALVCVASLTNAAPRPAVVRVIVQEHGAVSFGSGTLIDHRDLYGLVVTNWHVVRDAAGKIEVVFPDGFRSQARAVKLDEDWDLAALVVWRPNAEPVPIAQRPPRPGEPLTICGYGQGDYREATGRCTDFYAPEVGLPHELVELSVEARQGDSGGPILNSRGELAGVLFGAGQGVTLGSFAPRVEGFLASLAPDIGQPQGSDSLPETPALLAHAPPQHWDAETRVNKPDWSSLTDPRELPASGVDACCCCPPRCQSDDQATDQYTPWRSLVQAEENEVAGPADKPVTLIEHEGELAAIFPGADTAIWFTAVRDLLAVVGLAFLFLQLVKAAA